MSNSTHATHGATGALWSIRRTAAGLVAALALVGTGAGAATAATASPSSGPQAAFVSGTNEPGQVPVVQVPDEANRANRK